MTDAYECIPDDTPIWRYTDLAKLVLLLSDQTLHFSKLAALHEGDPYEGYGAAQGLDEPILERSVHYPPDDLAAILYAKASALAAEDVRDGANRLFVNSWCMGPESLGMWMLYGAQGRGVAVKSTIRRFRVALGVTLSPEHYAFGAVRYHDDLAAVEGIHHDFRRTKVPMSGDLWQLVLRQAFNKRLAYEYEREWRAAVYQESQPSAGVSIAVNLERLVEEIHMGPKAGLLEFAAVDAVMKHARFKCPVIQSTLLDHRTSGIVPSKTVLIADRGARSQRSVER